MSEENQENNISGIKVFTSKEDAEKLRKLLTDANQIRAANSKLIEEKEQLESNLSLIAEKEFNKRKDALSREGFDTSKINTPEDLKALEVTSQKLKRESWDGSSSAPLFNQYEQPKNNHESEEEGFDSVESMIQHYRDKAKNGDKNANAILTQLTDKIAKSGNHEWVFNGKLKDTRKPQIDKDAHETRENFEKRLKDWREKQLKVWEQTR